MIDAGELGPGSSLRRLIEGARNAAAIACYRDEGRDLGRAGRAPAGRGWPAARAGRARLSGRASRRRSRRHPERARQARALLRRPGRGGPAPGRVTLEAAALVVGDSAALELDDLVHAATQGEAAPARALPRPAARRGAGAGRAAARARAAPDPAAPAGAAGRGRRAARARSSSAPGRRSTSAARRASGRRCERWPAARLAAALGRLLAAEIGCKTTGWPAEALCRRALLGVCLEARAAAAAGAAPAEAGARRSASCIGARTPLRSDLAGVGAAARATGRAPTGGFGTGRGRADRGRQAACCATWCIVC